MTYKCFLLVFSLMLTHITYGSAQTLPAWTPKQQSYLTIDWLVKPIAEKAEIYQTADGKDIVLSNGLLKRAFRVYPNLGCTNFINLKTRKQFIRAVREEARLHINGKNYAVGGLDGQKEKGYLLPEWVDSFTTNPNAFQYVSFEIKPIIPQLNWKNKFWALNNDNGTGKTISFLFKPGAKELTGLSVKVNYEIYDRLPLMVKSLTLVNKSTKTFKLDSVVNEVLGMVEEESAVAGTFEQFKKPQGIYFETNYAFNNSMRYAQSDQTTHWKSDKSYTSQVSYLYDTPVTLEIYPDHAPGIELKPGETFNSVRTHELLMDSYDREAQGLAIRKMYGAVAPWSSANPIFMHLVSTNDQQVYTAIDQCAVTGYEAVIISFGSHLHMEDTSEANLIKWKKIADYAHSKNISIGCYSLFSSRRINDEEDVIDPKTNKPGGALFGHAPCFGSKWGIWYKENIKRFFTRTGFDIWENDGPYPGDICGSTKHPGHKNAEDSQWRQMEMQKELYHWLNARGIYINSPDWYFLDGSNKIAVGYREVNFKLPRAQQKILNRQNIFDGTWEKTPSMSWGFVPLTEYGGGGAAATLEPLAEHLVDYEQLMMQYYGSGIQACYRGPRLYDTEETKKLVINVVKWYKKYRQILNSDIIHMRRADGRDWDGILHANPNLKEKGLVMLYNPLKEKITRTIKVPLYYTGLTTSAKIREKEGSSKSYKLNRDFTVDYTFTLPAEGYSWFVIE